VLQGLNDSGVLEQLDAISTVSGGSYAALWYYTKRMELQKIGFPYQLIFDDCVPTWRGEIDEARFNSMIPEERETAKRISKALAQAGQGSHGFKKMDPCGHGNKQHFKPGDPYRWQAHLARWPDTFRYKETIPTGNKQSAPWRETAALIVRSFGEIPFSRWVETAAIPRSYQYGIERAWGLNPEPRLKRDASFEYTNDTGKPQTSRWHMDKVTWQELRALHEETKGNRKLPLWILNATNAPRRTGTNQERIFEITAYGKGSELTGYLRGDKAIMPELDLGTSVRASAAVSDSQGPGKHERLFFAINQIIPGSRWSVRVNNVFQKPPKFFWLSDGGHSENLGIYALMRRGVRDIIVVDAAQDIDGRMGDLCALIKILHDQNIKATFQDTLPNLDKVCKKETNARYNTSAWVNPVVPGEAIWPPESGLTSHSYLAHQAGLGSRGREKSI